jgi:hypothetical protein
MHEKGLFSKDEVRSMVFLEMGMTPPSMTPTPQPITPPTIRRVVSPKKPPTQHRVRTVFPTNNVRSPAPSPAPSRNKVPKKSAGKKSKAGKDVTTLRDIVKNVVRRRFFYQCTLPSSVLWYETKGGKQAIRRLLFEAACEDCYDELYALEPVKLRKVTEKQLEHAIHWQVGRDRNNWRGQRPKRASYTGDEMPYDFEAAQDGIEKAMANAKDLTGEGSDDDEFEFEHASNQRNNAANVKVEGHKSPKQMKAGRNSPKQMEPNAESDETKNCLHCRVHVWTGAVEECPKHLHPAHPLLTDWQDQPNAQPYCAKCWTEEQRLLAKMGCEHRAIGPKIKNKRDNAVVAANDAAIQKAISAATAPPPAKRPKTKKPKTKKPKTKKPKTKKPKKQLGGVRVVPKPKPPVTRWQVGRTCYSW